MTCGINHLGHGYVNVSPGKPGKIGTWEVERSLNSVDGQKSGSPLELGSLSMFILVLILKDFVHPRCRISASEIRIYRLGLRWSERQG